MTKPWKEYKQVILDLYQTQGRTLDDVRKTMKSTYGFSASPRAYRACFKNWGVYKYDKNKEKHERKVEHELRSNGSASQSPDSEDEFSEISSSVPNPQPLSTPEAASFGSSRDTESSPNQQPFQHTHMSQQQVSGGYNFTTGYYPQSIPATAPPNSFNPYITANHQTSSSQGSRAAPPPRTHGSRVHHQSSRSKHSKHDSKQPASQLGKTTTGHDDYAAAAQSPGTGYYQPYDVDGHGSTRSHGKRQSSRRTPSGQADQPSDRLTVTHRPRQPEGPSNEQRYLQHSSENTPVFSTGQFPESQYVEDGSFDPSSTSHAALLAENTFTGSSPYQPAPTSDISFREYPQDRGGPSSSHTGLSPEAAYRELRQYSAPAATETPFYPPLNRWSGEGAPYSAVGETASAGDYGAIPQSPVDSEVAATTGYSMDSGIASPTNSYDSQWVAGPAAAVAGGGDYDTVQPPADSYYHYRCRECNGTGCRRCTG